MSKEETTPGGLLSKVVRLVKNPTVNWTELDSIQDDRESQYSKQMLKEMIERKRRNDFVRRREFDQLRKLRQREVLQGQRVEDAAGRPSFFQSSMASPLENKAGVQPLFADDSMAIGRFGGTDAQMLAGAGPGEASFSLAAATAVTPAPASEPEEFVHEPD